MRLVKTAGIRISCTKFRRAGGIERYMLDVVRGFDARGVPVECLAREFDESLPEYASVEPVRLSIRMLPNRLRDYAFDRAIRRRLERDEDKARVLIAFHRTGAADIAICGGTHRGYLAAIGRRPRLGDRMQTALEVRCYENAHRVMAHSGLLARELRQMYGLPEEKVALIYPPVAADRFCEVDQEERTRLRRRFGFTDTELVLAFPSMDHRRKGLGLILEALHGTRLPVRLAIAGRPPDGGIDRRATFFGYVGDVENLYRAADYTILASTYEPLGLVAVESVLCGTPVLLSDRIAALEILTPEAAQAFDPTRPDDLRQLLEKVAAMPARRLERPMRHVGYDVSLEGHMNRLMSLVAEVAARKQAGK
jgi:glycosyltransferase involved in cell wall biosynthesis